MTTKVKKLVLCLGLLLASLLLSYQSAYADISTNVSLVRLGASPSVQWSHDGGTGCRTGSGSLYSSSGSCSMRGAIITLPYSEYLAGDIIEVDFNIIQTGNDNANNSWVHQLKADSTNMANTPVAIIDIEYENLNQNTSAVKVYVMVGAYTNSMPSVGISGNITLNQNDFLHIPYTACWRATGNGASEIVSAINNNATDLSTTNTKIDSVVSAIEDLQDTTEEYISVQQQANDDANDRYQDEKDTIYDEAGNGQDTMDDLSSDMSSSFSLPNPFTAFFGLFVNGCSVNIPTLSSWLGSVDTVYPSWWCTTNKLQTIRTALTGVFSFLAVCLTFSFVFKWLRTNSGEL